ncbi:MAG TPA: alpha/beta fold hydrolase [Candidatus Acidoferrales bacterium]|nr:alpha/beta fold hydrolase [Candidatus Acidoferrales bacterium]
MTDSLIARELLFGNAERRSPSISPDGRLLAWIAPDDRGIPQVWVETIGGSDARAVTADSHRGVPLYLWAFDPGTLLYFQDADGDNNFHTLAVSLAAGEVRDLTPWPKATCTAIGLNHRFPDQICISANPRDRRLMDVYRIDIHSGAATLDTLNPGDVGFWVGDDDFVIRLARVTGPDGAPEIRVRDDAQSPWRTMLTGTAEDVLQPLGFGKDGSVVFLRSSVGSDKARVLVHKIATGEQIVLAESGVVDADEAIIDRPRRVVQAVSFFPDRKRWTVIDPGVRDDFEALAKVNAGDLTFINRDLADRTWIVSFASDTSPKSYFAWDRASKQAKFLFSAQPKLDDAPLAEMKPITFRARDGMAIHAQLTLPRRGAVERVPMVLLVHGGDAMRDFWGFNRQVQMLANRGYAVLQVNYRGSSGYGKKYLHAADRERSGDKQNDLTDAVRWAVDEGIADPARVAIDGFSFGGYAALAGAAFTPDVYCCAVDLCGPSNLLVFAANRPAYAGVSRASWSALVGDPDRAEDRELLTNASPYFSADKIRIPLLIGQGANDPHVKPSEPEQLVAAIEHKRGRVTYVLYPDEGHGLRRAANRLDFAAREERFLAEHLGGRHEPMPGERYPGSSAIVREIGVA